MTTAPGLISNDVATLQAALLAEQAARRAAEQRASGAEAVIAQLKLMIAKMRHERFGASSERGRKLLDQLELQLEEMEAAATEDEAAVQANPPPAATRPPPTRRKPVRGPLPRPTCHASASSCPARPPAPAARAACPSWART